MQNQMPGVKQLFLDSWVVFKSKVGQIIVLSLIGSMVGILFTTITFLSVVGMGIFASLKMDTQDPAKLNEMLRTFFTPERLTQIGVGLFVVMLVSMIIFTITQIAIMATVGKREENLGIGASLSIGLKLLIPLIIMTFVKNFVVFGGFLLFIIPGMIIGFFLMFFNYEMVLSDKKWFKALSGSAQIISQHFGDIFVRILAVWLLVYLGFYLPIYLLKLIIEATLDAASNTAIMLNGIVSIVQFILSSVGGLYFMVYSIVMYQQAAAVTDRERSSSTAWMWVLSILGWLIGIFFFVQMSKLFAMPMVQEKLTEFKTQLNGSLEEETDEQKISKYLESMNPEVKSFWDESTEYFNQLRLAKTNEEAIAINDKNITVLIKATEISPDNPELWNALGDTYTWPRSKGEQTDSADSYKKAIDLAPGIVKYEYNYGEALLSLKKYEMAVLQFKKVLNLKENLGQVHISLGVAYKRLGMQDSAKEELEKGIAILEEFNSDGQFDFQILQAKKELETEGTGEVVTKQSSATTSTSKVATTPSCTRYPIREGEFASDKCYIKKDYDDLMYYLQAFNTAVFNYNGAVSSMNVTCNGSDFFRDSCESGKLQKSEAEAKMNQYRSTIQGIIAKGK